MARTQSKFYLSADARERLKRESDRTTYPMSVIVDMLVKAHLPADDEPFVGAAPYASPIPDDPKQETEDDDFKPDVY